MMDWIIQLVKDKVYYFKVGSKLVKKVLIAGAGKIGSLIACLLLDSSDYEVFLVDIHFTGTDFLRLQQKYPRFHTQELDVQRQDELTKFLKTHNIQAIISCLPFNMNIAVAKAAREYGAHYFDLTEDVSVTQVVKQLALNAKTAFVPQCGLAPGFVSIVANSLMKQFDKVERVKMRVGALPISSSNSLHYALTWSTDGLINEYGNLCHAIKNGEPAVLQPLEGVETIMLDGMRYEAFNTSGGLGSLPELYNGKVQFMNYKTIRYPGHCEKMRLLMNDLKLNQDRPTLKRILENAIPKTYQDVVIVYVSVSGQKNGELVESSYINKVYPQEIAGLHWSAIQVTTASGITSVVDQILQSPKKYEGLIYQESFTLKDFLANRFGKYYQQSGVSQWT
jgi:saccharopine dehydrogenase-like NADP-dependent oxidoreductase